MSAARAPGGQGRREEGAFGIVPGLALAVLVGVAGSRLSGLAGEALGLERSPVSPVMLSIVLGMIIGNTARLSARLKPGLRFAATRVLRLGIVLLGLRLSVGEVARLGLAGVPVVVACVLAGLLFALLLSGRLGLPARLGTLIGVGTAICGISAIAATGPGIAAKEEETAYAVSVITVFGLVAMLLHPYLAHLLFGGDPRAAGIWLGVAVHDTSQVNGAALIYAELHAAPAALDAAIVTKLVRNLSMLAVIPLLVLRHRKDAPDGARPGLLGLFPLFVLGFLLLAILRSVGDAGLGGGGAFGVWDADGWAAICAKAKDASTASMVVALSALGLSTDFRALARLSLRPFFVGLGAALAVGAVGAAAVLLMRTLSG